jgi:hypothetical protein
VLPVDRPNRDRGRIVSDLRSALSLGSVIYLSYYEDASPDGFCHINSMVYVTNPLVYVLIAIFEGGRHGVHHSVLNFEFFSK